MRGLRLSFGSNFTLVRIDLNLHEVYI